MKKLSLTLATASLTASLGAFAALPTDAQPFQLVVPNLKSGIDITLEGLYLQPSNSDLDYATVSAFSANSNGNVNGTVDVKTVDPDYNFGFRVGLGYTFPDSGNDVQLSWTHFNHTDSDSFDVANDTVATTRLGRSYRADNRTTDEAFIAKTIGVDIFEFTNDPEDLIYDQATMTSDAKFKLDAIDLDVGQYIDVGTRLQMRLFAGLRGAQVENNQTTSVNASANWDLINIQEDDTNYFSFAHYTNHYTEQFNSKFTGLGPRFGIDSTYHIGNCFGLVGQAAVALLVGQVETNTTTNDDLDIEGYVCISSGSCKKPQPGQLTVDETQSTKVSTNSDDVTRVVPALDAKLGLNYSHVFDNESILTIEAGYQVSQYIDAVDRLTTTTNSDNLNILDLKDTAKIKATSTTNVERTTSSVGFAGPYLSLNWKV